MLSDLTAIPRVMRHLKWVNGARLLETWFSRPRAVAPAYSSPDLATIRMDAFVLTFARARDVYDQILRDRIWSNSAGRAEVANMLRRKGLLGSNAVSFGRLGDVVTVQGKLPERGREIVVRPDAAGYPLVDVVGILSEAALFNPDLVLTPVGNRDFREWRQRAGKGGDFLVFSDVKRVPLNAPDEFVIR